MDQADSPCQEFGTCAIFQAVLQTSAFFELKRNFDQPVNWPQGWQSGVWVCLAPTMTFHYWMTPVHYRARELWNREGPSSLPEVSPPSKKFPSSLHEVSLLPFRSPTSTHSLLPHWNQNLHTPTPHPTYPLLPLICLLQFGFREPIVCMWVLGEEVWFPCNTHSEQRFQFLLPLQTWTGAYLSGPSIHHGRWEDGHHGWLGVQDALLQHRCMLLHAPHQGNIIILGPATKWVEEEYRAPVAPLQKLLMCVLH